ncbi:MAG: DUF4476 domain-containing protein [Paludibacter sp.]
MKRLFLIGFAFMATFALKAQTSNLNFFTEQGERFSLIIDGILQNKIPQTNILVTELPATKFKIKIVFENKTMADLDKYIYLSHDKQSSYVITRNSSGYYMIRFLKDISIAEAAAPSMSQSVISYHSEPETSTTTTSTTTVVKNNPNQGIGFNVQDPVTGANINMNVNVGGLGEELSNSSISTTTTTTTRSTGTVINGSTYSERDAEPERHHEHHNKDKYVLQGYNGIYGCQMPMFVGDFESAKKSISSKSFEDSKLTIAKQIIQSNCLLSTQVKEILLLFSFEETRLTFAKFAYAYTLDLGNYYKLNDAFTFESSIDELNKYIEGYRK